MLDWVVGKWNEMSVILRENAQIMDLVERTKLISDTSNKESTPQNILADTSH